MPSIKLGQLLSAANHFLGAGKGISAHPKAAAVDLLKKNPLSFLMEHITQQNMSLLYGITQKSLPHYPHT